MSSERATYRYLSVFAPAMLIYISSGFAISYVDKQNAISPMLLYLASCVPVLALMLSFYAQWRFVSEVDELLRLIHFKAMIFATASMLLIVTCWGTFELFAGAPEMPIFWLLPVFWVTHSLGTIVLSKRADFF